MSIADAAIQLCLLALLCATVYEIPGLWRVK